jgi:PKD repeat protein
VADFDNRGTGTFVLSTSTPLAALFSFTRRYGPAPLTINFTDLSPGTSLWSWDFGDGATSTDQNPSHTYTQSGAYTVNLIVANIVPEIDTLTTAIIVDWFEDGNVDLGDGTWVLDLDTMDGDQGLRNLNVDEGQAFAVEVIANRSVTDALELTLDVIYNPADIEPTTNIEGTVFPTEIDWAVSEGGLSSFAVSAVSPVSFEASGVGTISFKTLSGFTGHTEIWIVRAQTVHVNSVDTSRPYASVVVKSNVPVAPVGPFVLVDCDGDGDVDFQDFLIFVGAFGSQVGDSRYIASCNFNGDSTIDFSDFLIFATNFGRSPDE